MTLFKSKATKAAAANESPPQLRPVPWVLIYAKFNRRGCPQKTT
jgi:hypothetical protein